VRIKIIPLDKKGEMAKYIEDGVAQQALFSLLVAKYLVV